MTHLIFFAIEGSYHLVMLVGISLIALDSVVTCLKEVFGGGSLIYVEMVRRIVIVDAMIAALMRGTAKQNIQSYSLDNFCSWIELQVQGARIVVAVIGASIGEVNR